MELTTEYSPWFLILCVALGTGASWVLYRSSEARYEWSKSLVWLLAVLRAAVISAVAFFLLGPLVRYMTQEIQQPIVVIAHDGSLSMVSSADSTQVRSELVDRLLDLKENLSEDNEVRTFTFGERVREGLESQQIDKQTDIGDLFQEIENRYAGLNLGAVVISSDGIRNKGRDPLYISESLGVPIYTVSVGDTTIRTDLILADVDHNRITYKGNEFPIVVRYQANHLSGKSTNVVVYDEGNEVARAAIRLKGDPAIGETVLLVEAASPGIRRYTVELEVVNEEVNLSNNSTVLYIEVLDDRQKVLVLGEAPHPDIKAVSDALATNENYEVIRKFVGESDLRPEDHDLIVLHQIPGQAMPRNLLANAIAKKIPFWYFISSGTDLKALEKMSGGIMVAGSNGTSSDVQASLNESFQSFKLEPGDKAAIARFPPMQVPFGEHRKRASFHAVLNQRIGAVETDYPLLSVGEQDGVRYATMHGEGFWRWRIYDHAQNGTHELTNRIVNKVAQYLAVQEDKSQFRVIADQRFDENERVTFRAELYNDNYEAVNDPEVELQITDEEGNKTPFTFSRIGSGYRLDIGTLPAGRYAYQASTSLADEDMTAKGEFTVNSLLAERVNLVADHQLLAAISERTGGVQVGLDGISEIASAIGTKEEVVSRSISRSSLNDLVEIRWLFYLLLGLFTLEWALRRRNGAY